MTNILMILFVILFGVVVLYGITYSSDKKDFFCVLDAKALRGVWCIIIILVHIPYTYQNSIQDILGSFAYIGVTFFFMTSAYGLKLGVAKKENYLRNFWKKRLPGVLIPAFTINIIGVLFEIVYEKKFSLWSFLDIDNWVKVLLLYYLIFWLCYCLPLKYTFWKDFTICILIIFISLITKFCRWGPALNWPVESIGFIYGIIFSCVIEKYKIWSDRNWMIKTIALFLNSIIVGIIYLKYKSVFFWGDYCIKLVLGGVLLLFIFQLIRRIQLKNKFILFLGGISYEIYLLHRIIIRLFENSHCFKNSGIYVWASVICTCLGAVCINLMSKKIMNSIKICKNRKTR